MRHHFLLVGLLFPSASVLAQTTWYVDASNTPPGSGTQNDPYASIQYAIDQPATLDGDTVLVAAGTYLERIDFHGKALLIDGSLAITLPILDASGTGTVVSFRTGEGPASHLRGFTIQGGTGTATGSGLVGGGILVEGALPTLEGLKVQGCTAEYGGGMAATNGAAPILLDCAIDLNQAWWGGGIWIDAAQVSLESGSCSQNKSTHPSNQKRGGGVYVQASASLAASGTLFQGNTCAGGGLGGGIYLEGSVVLEGCTFRLNTPATETIHPGDGGGIYGPASATDCLFEQNGGTELTLQGGAASGGSYLRCTFLANQAQLGGGLASASAVDCTFTGNRGCADGSGRGGAMHGGTALNCLFSSNFSCGKGGAVYGVQLTDCELVGNSTKRVDVGVDTSGGAMFSGSAMNCVFFNNKAEGSATGPPVGGGAAAWATSIQDCTFLVNRADFGGAVASSSVKNSILLGNLAEHGGGAHSSDLTDCVVRSNQAFGDATSSGGGVWGGSATRTLLLGNSAPLGGGAINAKLLQCTLANNVAERGAGAAFDLAGQWPVERSSFVRNAASLAGGGLHVSGGSVKVKNSILWGDLPGAISQSAGALAVSYSIVEGGWSGTGNLDQDPLWFGPAGSDVHLAFGSPAIDSGDPAGTDMGAYAYDATWAGGAFPYCETDLIPAAAPLCVPHTASSGTPSISGAVDFTVNAADVPPGQFAILFHGRAATRLPIQAGILCVAPPLGRFPVQMSTPDADPCGGLLRKTMTSGTFQALGLAAGDHLYVQWWMRTPWGPSALTDAVDILVLP